MTVLAVIAERFAATIIDAVQREYPNAPRHVMRDALDRPTPREVHPAFYGCFDWHSAVEMHWALVALIRDDPDAEWVPAARQILGAHLTEDNLRIEARYFEISPGHERPYGWGWTLQLASELEEWAESGDADGARWAKNVRPLAAVIEAGFVGWLPKPAYPDRTGMHSNSAFAMSRALPYAFRRARAGDSALIDAIVHAAQRWFAADSDYRSAFEPSGSDFLSPTLTEIVLMADLLTRESFDEWLEVFLGDEWLSHNLLRPAQVTDADDGQGAHLHGLNLYRVHALRVLAQRKQSEDQAWLIQHAIEAHTTAGTEALSAEGWMAEHWLAAYGVLAFR
jgi:hypothetical protein